MPSEGGHGSFAPKNDEEIELLRTLRLRYGHVSWERVVSGPGLATLYRFERGLSGLPEPEWLAREIEAAGDAAPVVSRAALAESDPVCQRTMHRFVSLYGSEAGNFALKTLATGGVFVGGGIAPKILPILREGFFGSFCLKGRFATLLARIPIKVVLNDSCAILGAARAAAKAARGEVAP
jgi:glucokinase